MHHRHGCVSVSGQYRAVQGRASSSPRPGPQLGTAGTPEQAGARHLHTPTPGSRPGQVESVVWGSAAVRGAEWHGETVRAVAALRACVGWLTMEPVIPGPERPSPQQQLLPAVTPGHGGHHAHLPRRAGHRPGPRHRRGHQQTVHHLQREHPGCVLLPSGWSRPFYSYEHPRTCSTAVIFKIQVY